MDFRGAVALITTDSDTASFREDIFLYADFFTPCYDLPNWVLLAENSYSPVAVQIAIAIQDVGELEAARAVSATSSDEEILLKEGVLTMSHLSCT